MVSLSVSIQTEDFDIGQEHQALRAQDERVGADARVSDDDALARWGIELPRQAG